MQPRTVEASPGPVSRTVRMPDGRVVPVPTGWELLPPGDPLVTRRVKAGGDYWLIREKVGRREMSRGIWAPAERIAKAQRQAEAERATPEYSKKLAAGRARRDREQADYVVEFSRHVLAFLNFHATHAALAAALAERVAIHATPVGSGTVARTERIPVAERAEAAVIAWMRHQTTTYDNMTIPRDKGARREVRRMLAKRSREVLERYRRGQDAPESCPLKAALATPLSAPSADVADRPRLRPSSRASASPRPLEAPRVTSDGAGPSKAEERASDAPRPSPVRSPTPRPSPRLTGRPTSKREAATETDKPAPAAPHNTPTTPRPATASPSRTDDDPEMARRAARQAAMRARLRQ